MIWGTPKFREPPYGNIGINQCISCYIMCVHIYIYGKRYIMRIYYEHEHLEWDIMGYPPKLVDFFRHPLSPPTLVCRGNLSQSWMSLDCWLVVYLPLWKRWVRQLGWWQANIWKNQIHVPDHQPDWFLGTFTGTRHGLRCRFSQQNQSNENGFPQNMGLWTARVEITITQCVCV